MRQFAILAAIGLAMPAAAQMSFTDDFTDGLLDPTFGYDFSSDFTGGGDFNSIDAMGLLLASDEVVITFPGIAEPVGLFQIDFSDFTGIGATEVEVFGTLGSVLLTNTTIGGPESIIVTPTDGLGEITSVRVSAFETFFERITVRTIPAPSTAALFGLGALAARRRR